MTRFFQFDKYYFFYNLYPSSLQSYQQKVVLFNLSAIVRDVGQIKFSSVDENKNVQDDILTGTVVNVFNCVLDNITVKFSDEFNFSFGTNYASYCGFSKLRP